MHRAVIQIGGDRLDRGAIWAHTGIALRLLFVADEVCIVLRQR